LVYLEASEGHPMIVEDELHQLKKIVEELG
jgi:hypothetical protein